MNILLPMLILQLQAVQAPQWRPVHTARVHWQEGTALYTLAIETPADTASVEEQRLRIRIPGRRDYVLRGDEGGFVSSVQATLNSSLVADNLARSPYFYLSPNLRGVRGTPMLVVFGWAFASDPGSIHIIALDSMGYPIEVFHDSTFLLTALVDLDADGRAEIIGKRTLSQCGGCDDCSYDPYSVYHLPNPPHHRARYDLALSRSYNLAHYVWAGPSPTESLEVNVCRPGKPHIAGGRHRG